jgi:ketosteroid isomerase-like protein
MPDSARPTRLEAAQQFVMHIGHRDSERAMELLSPRVVYRVQGQHQLAGTFSGREAVTTHLMRLLERTKGTFEALKWEDWLLGENHVAALANIRVEADGRLYTGRHLYLVSFDIDDKIAEVVVFFEDQRAVERFFGD